MQPAQSLSLTDPKVTTTATPEPGSFRDRQSRIFYHEGKVLRALSGQAAANWNGVNTQAFFKKHLTRGSIIGTKELSSSPLPSNALDAVDVESLLEHEEIPFISYPYEWCFGMLQRAALLQLEIIKDALSENTALKDATPYNIQWCGARPVFIDIGSFEPFVPGSIWVGYRQFCQLFLYPLLLQAYRGIAFHPLLRGNLDGITPTQCARFFSGRDLVRRGIFRHVYLHSKFESLFSASTRKVGDDLKNSGFSAELIQQNIKGLTKLISRLSWQPHASTWSHYADACPSYTDQQLANKKEVVDRILYQSKPKLVWDIGCNTGTFSRLAAQHSNYVIAMDGDHLAVERMYHELYAESNQKILPLVMNIADYSPSLGWRGLERKSLTARSAPDLVMCLALIHHVVISAHVPLRDYLSWLSSLGATVIVEFVGRDDPMTKKLLLNKGEQYAEYCLEYFERCFDELFVRLERHEVVPGQRILFVGKPRN